MRLSPRNCQLARQTQRRRIEKKNVPEAMPMTEVRVRKTATGSPTRLLLFTKGETRLSSVMDFVILR